MCDLGWDRKPGVQILFGRWQDVQQQLGVYDGIFFDTYGEYYEELRQFHLLLPKILKPDGVYSYFNGLASDNFFFHMVYGR
jgi:protein arginine N-methyltransferase 2